MFDIGWSEMLVIACLAIVVIGPKQLPAALKTLGFWMGKARRMAREFQGHVDEMVAQAELDDVKKEVNSIANLDINEQLEKKFDPDFKDNDEKGNDEIGGELSGLEDDGLDPNRYTPDGYEMVPSNSIVPPADEDTDVATSEDTDIGSASRDEEKDDNNTGAWEVTVEVPPIETPEEVPVKKEQAGT